MDFTYGATTIHFDKPPLRPGQSGINLRQPSGRDTVASIYSYTKSSIKTLPHPLTLIVTKSVLDALLAFHLNTVLGTKRLFTWVDPDSQSHTVRFANKSIPWRRLGPDRYEVSCPLREDLPL